MTFEKLIMDLDVNVTLDLEKYGKRLKDVRFDSINVGIHGLHYSWSATISYKNSGMVGYDYPMKNVNYIKTFATINGAKRNFIKRYKEQYEKIVCKLEKK